MSKTEFIERVASTGNLSKAEAKRAVELVFGEIETTSLPLRARIFFTYM